MRNLLALAALLAGLLLVLYFVPQSQLAARDPLIEIQTVETLRAQFNRDAGKTRLILLLSPT
jgi:hypothetical protein